MKKSSPIYTLFFKSTDFSVDKGGSTLIKQKLKILQPQFPQSEQLRNIIEQMNLLFVPPRIRLDRRATTLDIRMYLKRDNTINLQSDVTKDLKAQNFVPFS